jgi:hypothetical protein
VALVAPEYPEYLATPYSLEYLEAPEVLGYLLQLIIAMQRNSAQVFELL